MENRDNVKEKEEKEKKENSATDVLAALLKQIKIMWIALFVLLAAFFITNGIWIYVFQSYDYVSQDGEGYNYFNRDVGGDVFNGAENQDKKEGEVKGN